MLAGLFGLIGLLFHHHEEGVHIHMDQDTITEAQTLDRPDQITPQN